VAGEVSYEEKEAEGETPQAEGGEAPAPEAPR
jgi:hypothetical protein